MRAYRVVWLTIALTLGVFGFGAAIVLLKATLLVLLPLFAIVGAGLATPFVNNRSKSSSRSRNRRLALLALLWSAVGGALAGFTAWVGPVGLLVAVLLAGVAPRALRACRRGLLLLPRPTAAQVDAMARSLTYANPTYYVPYELTLDLSLLTDDQLGKAWRDSRPALSRPPSQRELLRVVAERGRYLDELERRQPCLLKAWLECDAGLPDSLLPYADASRLARPAIDWDELIGGQETER